MGKKIRINLLSQLAFCRRFGESLVIGSWCFRYKSDEAFYANQRERENKGSEERKKWINLDVKKHFRVLSWRD